MASGGEWWANDDCSHRYRLTVWPDGFVRALCLTCGYVASGDKGLALYRLIAPPAFRAKVQAAGYL